MINLFADIFKISESPDKVICPPDQVFKNNNFEFLITIGGHIVEDSKEYSNLMILLKDIGEKEFILMENNGAIIPHHEKPFEAIFSTDSTLDEFDNKIKEFDEDFLIFSGNFFIFGQMETWGIYVCEYPTIIIVGCIMELSNRFRDIYNIKGNGYEELKSFLDKELKNWEKSGMKEEFLNNYQFVNQ